MAANTGKLAGRTLFITGASRGIGKAIGLKAARDGANVVIAAKTAETHAKLPGTIYTAAKEIEDAGGQCLPCVVDIRNEDQVLQAIEQAVKQFGGIDILVNNASAISLTNTPATPVKRFDLMMGVNTRGTYLCSQACLPHLMAGTNPHILNLSPPLNMKSHWFSGHVAYTMAKYGMSMCVLGMAEEFKPEGIAVNALWPRTAILTAAMEMLGGDSVASQCRKPEIIADAAYLMLCKDSKSFTGNFCIDDEVLTEAGITDMEQYICVPGGNLLPDFFLDVAPDELRDQLTGEAGASSTSFATGEVGDILSKMQSELSEDMVKSINGIYQFELKGDNGLTFYLDLKNGGGGIGEGDPPGGEVQCKMTMKSDDFVKLFKGELKATNAFMSGMLKVKGDIGLSMKLEKLMGKMKSKL